MVKPLLFFIGVDAAEPSLLRRWMSSGDLPNLAALCRESRWGDTASPDGFGDGVFWTSVNTGLSPGRHGRCFNWHLRAGTYSLYRYNEDRDFTVPTLWEILSEEGLSCAVIDLVRAKLSPALNGIQIADWMTHDPIFGARSTPAHVMSDVIARFGDDPFAPFLAEMRTKRPEPGAYLDAALQRIEAKTRYVESLLNQGRFDVVMAAYSEAHDVGHAAWHLHDPTHEEYDGALAERLGYPLLKTYKALDDALGRLIAALPAETSIMLMAGPGIRPVHSGRHLLPRVLHRLEHGPPKGIPAAKEAAKALYHRAAPQMIQKAVRTRLRKHETAANHDDWADRLCFVLPHAETMSFIRVNLEGREPKGRVARADFDRYRASLAEDLLDLVDPATGARVVENVVDVIAAYPGPNKAEFPDLVVEWNPNRPISAMSSPKIGTVRAQFQPLRTGDHNHACFFAVRQDGIVPGEAETQPNHLDLIATIPALAGIAAKGLDGTPLMLG